MRFSDFLLVSDPSDLNFIVGYSGEQNIRIDVADFIAGNITGFGTIGYVPVFTGPNSIGDSVLFQDGSNLVVGGEDSLGYKLAIGGSLLALDGAVIESSVPGSNTFKTIGEEGDSFIIPNDLDESIFTPRRIIHAPAILTTESATLGQLNAAISNLEGDIEILLDLKVDKISVGVPNGVASLDSGGKIPLSQIPDSIIGQVQYMGTWNAFTNTPTLNPLVPEEKGHYYVVSAAGVFGGVDYQIGDWIISNGLIWEKVDNTDAVTSVFGRIGAILALEADYQSFYPRLSQAYDNPTWINTLAFSKITGVPPFLLENQTITLSGDVTGSGKTSIASTISNNAVTDSKLRDSVGTSVIGRASSTTGDPADIQASTDGHVLQRSGGTLLFGLISSDSIGSIDWSKIINTPTTLSGYGITNAYTKTESDNKFVPYTGANANVNLGSNNITANSFIKAGGTSAQFLKADGSVDTSQYVPITRSINAGTGLTGGGNLSSDVNIAFDTTWGDTRYAYRTRQLTINGTTYDLSADRTWNVGTVNTLTTIGTSGPATLVGDTLNIPNYTTDLSGYVTLATDQTITGLKTILRSGDVLNFKIGTDTLYGLKLFYSQNELVPSGEATWSFVNTFNRDGSGYEVTPLSFFRGVLVTGQRLLSSGINSNLLDYYANNPTGRYPVYAYNTGVQQFANAIVVGETNGIVNAVSGAISDLPSGVVANFKGRVIGSNAVNSNEFVTLSQLPSLTGYVPYTGATQNVNLGEYGISAGYFEADLTPTQSAGVGRLIWNNADGTLNLRLLGGNVDLHLGQQQYARVVNGTGGNVLRSNYQVVKIIGAQGQRVQVGLARADNDFNSKDTLGLVSENINNNQEGFIISNGILEEINTTGSLQGETWNDGDTLYLSGSIYGQLTNIKPSAPIHTVIVGFVAYAHANHGKIFVKVDNGYELEELHDVNPLPYVNNGLLYRDTATNLWKSATISTILGYTPAPQGNYITALTGEATATGPGSVNITLSNSAVTGKVLTGLNVTGNAISSTDSILTAFGKLQNQVNQLVGGLQYEGTWNASTNTPTITSSVGTDGTFYIVSVAGTTNINGINDWQVGDWIVFHDTSWQKVDNSDSVSSVFGRVGNIVANQSDYSAFYPLISDIKDGVLTVQGTGVLSGSGTFSANQATNNTITLTHSSVSRTDTTSAQTPSFGGSFTVVDSITSSAQGHITAINTKTVTVPSTIATATQTGLLSNTDWITFNAKQNAITLTTTGTSGAATLVGSTLNIPQYQAAGTYVTGVTASSPLFSSGGTTPNITIQQATATQDGFLSSTDWSTFNNKANANGSNASGTWGISITGNAATVGTFAETAFAVNQRGGDISSNATIDSSFLRNGMYRVNSGVTSSPDSGRFWALNVYGNQNNVVSQLASDFQTGETFVRSYNSAWSSWRRIIDTSNYNSYSPTLTGGGASGTWGINITGSATSETLATVTARGASTTSQVEINRQNSINATTPGLTTGYGLHFGGQTTADLATGITFSSGSAIPTNANAGIYVQGSGAYGSRMYIATTDSYATGSKTAITINEAGNVTFNRNSAYISLIYDRDNTAYYLDPNSTGTSINIAGQINTTKSNGTLFSINGVDNIGYNDTSGLGTYIKGSGNTYIYGGGIYFDGSTQRTMWHSGNAPRAANSNLMYYQGFTLDANTMDTNSTGFTYSVNAPYTGPIARFSTNGGYDLWLNAPYGGDGYGLAFRTRNGDAGTFNSWRYPAVYNVNVNGGGSLYATIYYDQNDTGYYLNPNSTSVLYDLSLQGLKNTYLYIQPGNGYEAMVYYSGGSGSPWYVGKRVSSQLVGTADFHFFSVATSQTVAGIDTGGNVYSVASMRSPIFYDSNNTSYYIDGAGTSVLNLLNINGGSSYGPTYFVSNLGGYSGSLSSPPLQAFSTANNSAFMSFHKGGHYAVNMGLDADNVLRIGGWSAAANRWQLDMSGNVYVAGSSRAPIFYDLDNTNYYLDASGGSVSLRIAGSVFSDGSFATNGYGTGGNAVVGRVYGPKGGAYSFSGGAITGAIKIRLPFRANDSMWSMKVRIYNYGQYQTSEYLLGNYSYSQGAWNFSASYLGGSSSSPQNVRFGNDGSYDCVWIGETSTGWSYPVVSVMDFMAGYSSGGVENNYQNWDISVAGSFGTVGVTISPDIRFSNVTATTVNAPSGYVSNGNPWGTANSAYFPNGITTAGGTNWIYGTQTYIGNAPSNGAGHEFFSSGSSYSTGDMEAGQSMRAPIFYDRNDTSYYANPSDTSRFVNLLLGGATATGFALNITGNAQIVKSSTSTALIVGLSGVTGSVIRFSYNGGFVGSISTDGSNTAYNTSSDYRLKEDIMPIENSVSKILSLNPVNFKYKSSKTRQDGFLAHELQEVLPYLVFGEKDAVDEDGNPVYQEVDYSKLTPILIAAIKELKTEIETLKTKQ